MLNGADIQKEPAPANLASVPLEVEEVEPMIAQRLAGNHNETVLG
jgi:hypothetical protein